MSLYMCVSHAFQFTEYNKTTTRGNSPTVSTMAFNYNHTADETEMKTGFSSSMSASSFNGPYPSCDVTLDSEKERKYEQEHSVAHQYLRQEPYPQPVQETDEPSIQQFTLNQSIPSFSGHMPQSLSANIPTSMEENSRCSPREGNRTPSCQMSTPSGAERGFSQCEPQERTPVKPIATDETPVRKLPKSCINLLGQLNRQAVKDWQALVELHGWDYDRTRNFLPGCSGYFCALLEEPEFQLYTVGDLRADLKKLPRFDLLDDFEKLINPLV